LLTQGLELRFEVLVLKQIPKELFIHSNVPEEVVLAILCDFEGEQPEQVVRQNLPKFQSHQKVSKTIVNFITFKKNGNHCQK
jgi:hypothetical protein